MKYDCIVLDMDGTMIESIDAKTNAFRQMFEQYGQEVVDRVVEHHLQYPGVNRSEKIYHYYLNFLNKRIDRSQLRYLSNIFGSLADEEIRKCDTVEGLYEFLVTESTESDIYVLTAAPENEAKFTLAQRGLDQYIKHVYGYPSNKTEVLTNLNKVYDDVVMIGDSLTDVEAAMQSDIDLIIRLHKDNKDLSRYGTCILNFNELLV